MRAAEAITIGRTAITVSSLDSLAADDHVVAILVAASVSYAGA